MSRYELLWLVVAAIALLAALAVFLRKRFTGKRPTRSREAPALPARHPVRMPAADRTGVRYAELRVELVGPPDERRFVFSNRGPGAARNVRFCFADLGDWSAPVIAPQFAEMFPIRELAPNQQCSCIAALHLGHPSVLTGIFTWDDDAGATHRTTCRIHA